jgi:4-hydroxy-tetrahydrodipicolinate reductase
MINVAVAGATGRMGHVLIEAVQDAPAMRLSGALARSGSPALGQDAGDFHGRPSSVVVTDDLERGLAGADVLIDFTRPESTMTYLSACSDRAVRMVIGTTGLTGAHLEQLRAASQHIAIVFSPNMSVGINVVFKLVEIAARALDDRFDVEIAESHHRNKVDAPSGTALRLGEIVAAARGAAFEQVALFSRHGITGPRPAGSIGFSSARAGDIVGDHTVLFAGEGERIEITHRSGSRRTYAEGSLRAVEFLMQAAPGLYDMQDVLGLR